MHQLQVPGFKIPKVYVVDNKKDADLCRINGIPYIKWKGDDDTLIKMILYPALKKMFPNIKWESKLGIACKKQVVVNVPAIQEIPEDSEGGVNSLSFSDDDSCCYSSSSRHITGAIEIEENEVKLGAYVGDLDNQVNIEKLQALHLLPVFVDDIATAVRNNLENLAWWEGYNKKRGCCIGNFNMSSQLPNLLIIDVSASIPRGIADTMLALADSLRGQCNAELIITGAKSYWWDSNEELPSAYELRNKVPPSNEAAMFYRILSKLEGKHYANVIVFGDEDRPSWFSHGREKTFRIQVDHIMAYHTMDRWSIPGYGLWAANSNPDASIEYDTSWCKMIK